jgi:glucose-1-phosphate thymidylyltransferase
MLGHMNLYTGFQFCSAVEERQGLMIACPEEIAYRMGYITKDELYHLAQKLTHNQYGKYLLEVIKEGYNEIKYQAPG